MESSNGDELTPNQLINGLFEEVQQGTPTNPFDETFRDAIHRIDRSLPQPLSRSYEPDPLDTPQVVSNAETDHFQNSYPMAEDDDVETHLMYPLNLDGSESLGTEIVNTRKESNQTNIDNNNSQKKEPVDKIKRNENLAYNTFSSELPRKSLEESSNKLVFLEVVPSTNKQKVSFDLRCTNMQISKSENLTSNSIQSSQIFNTQLLNNNVLSIPTKVIKLLPHPESTKDEPKSAVKQKLKNLLKPGPAKVVRMHVVDNPRSPQPIPLTQASQEFDKRERNRMAQKRSRIKKKTLLTQLTTKLESMRSENKSLRLENTNLRKELVDLKVRLLSYEVYPLTRATSQSDISGITTKNVQPTMVNGNHRSPYDTVIQPLMRSNTTNSNQNNKLIIEAENNVIELSSNNKNANSNENFNKKPPLRVIINKYSKIGTDSNTNDVQSTVPKRIIQLNENGTPEITDSK